MKKLLILLLLLPVLALAQVPVTNYRVLQYDPATGHLVPTTTNGHTIGPTGTVTSTETSVTDGDFVVFNGTGGSSIRKATSFEIFDYGNDDGITFIPYWNTTPSTHQWDKLLYDHTGPLGTSSTTVPSSGVVKSYADGLISSFLTSAQTFTGSGTSTVEIGPGGDGIIVTNTTGDSVFQADGVSGDLFGSGLLLMGSSPTTITNSTGKVLSAALVSTITAGGPTGSSSAVPVITYNAAGQLTAVTTASISTGLTIGTTAITSGTGTHLLYETSGNKVGEISGATSDGTAVTLVAPVLGTPASGTVTNLTGTASININGTVGATTPAAGTFTTGVFGSTTSLLLGTASSAVGNIGFRNATSGTATLAPPTGALSTYTVTLPNAASTLPIFGQQITVSGPSAARTWTAPDASFTMARTDAANTFTGVQSMTSPDVTTEITSPSTTVALFNVTPTTVNAFGGASTALNIGNASGMNTVLGFNVLSTSGAASKPSLNISGVPFAGTGTTSFPLVYINDTNATASTTLNTAGTALGVNSHGTQDLIRLMKDGVSVQNVDSAGKITIQFSGATRSSLSAATNGNNGLEVARSDGAYKIQHKFNNAGYLEPSNDNGDVWLGEASLRWAGLFTRTVATGTITQTDKTTTYNNIATAGNGLVAIVKATRVTAQSAANSSICTYTAPASDGSYEVSMNLNASAVTAMSASLNCDYTDEGNTARTMIFPVQSLAGNFVTGGLITATGPYETPVMHIRVKASTAITLYTSTGTYTGVTYTAEGIIKQTQ